MLYFILVLGASILSASCGFNFRCLTPSTGTKGCSRTASIIATTSIHTPSTSFAGILRNRPVLYMSSPLSGDEDSDPINLRTTRRRVRRKDDGDAKAMDENVRKTDLNISNDAFEMVEVKIRNVRDIGRPVAESALVGQPNRSNNSDIIVDNKSLPRNSGNQQQNINDSSTSLETLLSDAKRMRAAKGGGTGTNTNGVGDKIINLLSTIVTFDFFVVCGLLLWFLAGVFCSYVVKDDTVQIAFNGIFQPVVQPALGILMIGSAASAILKGKQSDDGE